MARLSEVVKQALSEINQQTKEIKQADDDDFAKVSAAFDRISQRADQAAETFANADKALQGKGGEMSETEQPKPQPAPDEDEGEEEE